MIASIPRATKRAEKTGEVAAIPARPEYSYATYVGRPSRHHLMTHLSLLTQPEQQSSTLYSIPSHFLPSFRYSSATAITPHEGSWHQTPDRFGVEVQIKRNQSPKLEQTSSAHNTALRAVAAWTPGHNRRTALSFFPTADVYCPTWPRPLETTGNRVVAPDPPKTPTSSVRQTPPRGVDSHGRNCARSDSLDSSGC